MTLLLSPKKVALVFTTVVLWIILAHVSTGFFKHVLTHDVTLRFFDLDHENNLPTWYSSSALLLCAVLLTGIGLHKRQVGDRYARHWIALAIIFAFLSLDEMASIHERTIIPLQHLFGLDGYFRFAWVVLGGPFVFILALAYLPLLNGLPRRTRNQFICAGTLYIGGALGIEMVGAKYISLYGKGTLMYWNIYTLEESLEMFGVVVFIYALVSYMSSCVKEVTFRFDERMPITPIPARTQSKSAQTINLPAA